MGTDQDSLQISHHEFIVLGHTRHTQAHVHPGGTQPFRPGGVHLSQSILAAGRRVKPEIYVYSTAGGTLEFLHKSRLGFFRRFRRRKGVHQHQHVLLGLANHVQQCRQVLIVGQIADLGLKLKGVKRRSRQGREIRTGPGWGQSTAAR